MVSSNITAHSDGGSVVLNLTGMVVTRVSAGTGGGNVDVVLPEDAANLSIRDVTGAGNVTVETTGTGAFAMGDGMIAGDVTLDTAGYTNISGTTPGGALDLTTANLEALIHLQTQAASFTTPVTFSITRVDPIALMPESGLGANGSPATIDPIAAYQITFAVPTLNRDAALSFDIDVAQLGY